MKINFLKPVLLAFVFFATFSCNDRQKRIAELESQIAEGRLKQSDSMRVAPTSAAQAMGEEKPEGPLAVAEFETAEHDFGTIKEGQIVEYTFKVKNTGEAPLVIVKADPSCGCTVPDWTKTPIPVGGSGFVHAKFDSGGKQGAVNKTITVTANTWPQKTTLRFKANILPKSNGENGPVK